MKNKANIAVFVPHAGCPYRCSFCDQRIISGQQTLPTPDEVAKMLAKAVAGLKNGRQAEIAFFGGSFTAIDRQVMEGLLQAAHPFVDGQTVTGIRCSTRPDAIDEQVLVLLKQYGVTTIELGAQSMDDAVLALNHRGHTAADVERASALILNHGFSLGLQMMTGLHGADTESDRATAKKLLALRPHMVRIYPTLTLKGTDLETLYQQGDYTPPDLEETVALCAELLLLFESAGIPVIKLGLHAGAEQNAVAGPYHPALRELCESQLYYIKSKKLLGNAPGQAILRVHPTCVSKMVGQRRQNLHRLAHEGWQITVQEDKTLAPGEIEKGEISCS